MLPSGPVRMNESCLKPTALLSALAVSAMAWLHVLPPSVDREKTIGSGIPGLPLQRVQLAYTLPKNGLLGLASAETQSLSLKSTGFVVLLATTGAAQWAPSSIERDTANTGGAVILGNATLLGKARLP